LNLAAPGGTVSFSLLFLMFLAPPDQAPREARIRQLIGDIAQSGRVLEIGEKRERLADPRKQVAPGAPPLLSFRYFVGADRHRFGKLDLMLDDAGH
jgi:hypothetical protein